MSKWDTYDWGEISFSIPYKAPVARGSAIDPVGKVFIWEERIFRAITESYLPIAKKILKHDEFFDAGLVGTELTNFRADPPYHSVLEHKRIIKALSRVWSPSMAIDAMKMVCNFYKVLDVAGFGLKDGHPNNVLFDFSTPVWIDFSSILPREYIPNTNRLTPLSFPWEFSGEFITEFGSLIESNTENLNRQEMFKIREKNLHNIPAFFDDLIAYLETARLNVNTTEWRGYPDRPLLLENLNPKQEAVYNLLRALQPAKVKTLIDIGGNKGSFSVAAAELGYRCICFDLDISSIDYLYNQTKNTKRTILPLVMDFMKMTPSINGQPPAVDRFRSDVSLYLALVHHLTLGAKIPFDEQAHRISQLTEKYAIVEFIPKDDVHVIARGEGWSPPEWYTEEKFTEAMGKEGFMRKITIASSPSPRLILLYGREK